MSMQRVYVQINHRTCMQLFVFNFYPRMILVCMLILGEDVTRMTEIKSKWLTVVVYFCHNCALILFFIIDL